MIRKFYFTIMEVTDGKQFAAYMRTVRKRTLDVIGKVPTEYIHWRLSPDSMSVVDIILHIASVEKSLWGSGSKDLKPGNLDEFPKDKMNLEEALLYMADVRKESVSFWTGLDQEFLYRNMITPTGDEVPVKRWLVLAAEHEIHHRSFVHAYRKIWGLSSSPIYGLTFDELRNLLNRTH